MEIELDSLKTFINGICPMNDLDWQAFSSRLQKMAFKKNDILLNAGQTERYLSFITKGMVRLYIPKPGGDLTFGFVFENHFVTAYDSFITQTPSLYEIETLADTELWRISYRDLEDIYAKTETGNIIGRKMAENMFLLKSARELSLLNKTAEERYIDLFAERPNLIKNIPLKYIASYIGVTPQALSRIRKRIF